MVRRLVRELVAGEAVAELALEGDAALGEELQRPVDGGVADASSCWRTWARSSSMLMWLGAWKNVSTMSRRCSVERRPRFSMCSWRSARKCSRFGRGCVSWRGFLRAFFSRRLPWVRKEMSRHPRTPVKS